MNLNNARTVSFVFVWSSVFCCTVNYSSAQKANVTISSNTAVAVSIEDGIDEAEFKRLFPLLNLPSDKPWRKIPWKTSLLDSQNSAAQSGKPIFIWAMDGHPLGCT